MRSTLLVVALLLVTLPVLYAAEMVTIRLQNRLPEDVASLLKPLLQPDERIVVAPDGLIVMAEPQRIGEIRRLVKQLDQRATQFVVSVVQSNTLTAEQLNTQVGLEARVPLKSPGHWQGRVYGGISHSDIHRGMDTRQTIRVLEGHSGFIEVGEEQPVSVIESDGYFSYTQQLGYRQATTGFQLLPRMLGGCRVLLQISPWSVHAMNDRSADYRVQSAETTLEVALGKWFELGSHQQDEQQSQNQLLGYQSRQRQQHSRILLKVDAGNTCHAGFSRE
ncbi:MAG TPA: hypothetical protein ENJ32_08805 [Crenotrichaceae bacterium]|nr:hypothetical protein [Crenotrichaceae bacterium]